MIRCLKAAGLRQARSTRTVWIGQAAIAMLLLPAVGRAQIPSAYTISTIAGTGVSGFTGDAGAATSAQMAGPFGIAVDSAKTIFVADQLNHRLRTISASGTITTVAGKGTAGFSGDAAAATSAELKDPLGVAVDGSGNMYIADTNNHVIRKVVPGGNITTYAGNNGLGGGFSGDNGPATDAQLNLPAGVALDSAGNLYIADLANHRIRMVSTSGTITTVAGNGSALYSGDNLPAINTSLNAPQAVAVDSAGNLYIADTENHRVRKVSKAGVITTIAGGLPGYSGDGGPAVNSQLFYPKGVAVDSAGNVYIADYLNSRIRRVTANGAISTIAGNGAFGYYGDGGAATSAALFFPASVALDKDGNVYFSDSQNNVVRMLKPSATLQPPFINSVASAGAFGAFSAVAPGTWIEIYGTGLASTTRQWRGTDFVGINAPQFLEGTSVTIGGLPAYVAYISPGQVNALVPSNVGTGPQPVIVSTAAGPSQTFTVSVDQIRPGLLAPPTFVIGGKQYVAGILPDGVTYALPTGAIPGVPSRPAKPGELVTLYGIGFGPVTPDMPAGQIVQQANTLASPLLIQFNGINASPVYDGLAPNSAGLYQFNLTVPSGATGDAVALTFSVGSVQGTQTLYIAVSN